jgi:hypothetical protein
MGTGHTPSRSRSDYWGGEIPWIGIRDANAHHGRAIRETAQTITPAGIANSAAVIHPAGTVCLSRTASVGYVVKMDRDMATSQDFATWTCSEALDPDYLMMALQAEGQEIRRFGEGSTHTTIYFPALKAFHIALPPIAEQRRIVTKLEVLTARLTRARAELDRVPMLASRLRSESLRAVFDIGEAAEDGIAVVSVGEVAEITSGYGFPKQFQGKFKGEYPFAKVSDISHAVKREGGLLRSAVNYVDRDDLKLLRAKSVAAGSTVFAKIGEALRLNRRALAKCDLILDNNCMALTPAARLNPEYLFYFMQTVDLAPFAVATTVPSVRRGDVAGLQLPLPSFDRQGELVDVVKATLARADRLEAEATRARNLLDRLEAALMAKAFRGELVQQDPADEPASALLDRIRQSRAAAPKAKRGRKAKEPA